MAGKERRKAEAERELAAQAEQARQEKAEQQQRALDEQIEASYSHRHSGPDR